jgi:hypothetical protein
MAVQQVREQNRDATGCIRVREQGVVTVFSGPAPGPFHFYRRLDPSPTQVFKGRTHTIGGLTVRDYLAITSFTVSNQDFDPHFVLLKFIDHAGNQVRIVTEPLVLQGSLHFAYPHPIVLPLFPSDSWSLEVEDEAPSAALLPITIVGYSYTVAVKPIHHPVKRRKSLRQ